MKNTGYIVMYDNGEFEFPYGWDRDCPGAIQSGRPVVLFPKQAMEAQRHGDTEKKGSHR